MRIAQRLLQRLLGLSLGAKLACTFVLLIYGVAMALALVALHHLRADMEEELIRGTTLIAENTARLATDLILREDIWELYKLSRDTAQREASVRHGHPVLYVMILSASGEVLAHSRPALMPVGTRRLGDPVWERALGASAATVLPLDGAWRQRGIEVAAPILLDGRKLGILRVGVTQEAMEEHLRQMKLDAVLLSTLLALGGISLALVISRRMTRPLQRLMVRAEELSRGQFGSGPPAVAWEKDEIGRLADTFNEMARRLGATLEEMREAREYLRSLLEGADDYICTADMAGRLTYVNRKFEELGYIRADLIGRNFCEILALPDLVRDGCRHACRDRMSCETLFHLVGRTEDVELRGATGPARLAVVSVTALADGRPEGPMVLMIGKDITERRHLEEQLRRSERLAALGVLAGGVAHEIRNPLAGIRLGLEALEGNGVSDTERRDILARVTGDVHRLNAVVTRMLGLARTPAPQRVPTDLWRLVDRALFFVGHHLRSRRITVHRHGEARLWVLGDPDQIQQVLLNLLLNAAEAMPDGGALRLVGRRVDSWSGGAVDSSEPIHIRGDWVELAVGDTGPGIRPEDLPQLFTPFFTTKDRGTGLGLFICRRIVAEHNGALTVESTPGAGTTVTLVLPAAEGADAPAVEAGHDAA